MQANPFWPTFAVDPRKIEAGWRPLFAETLQSVSAEFDRRFPRAGSPWPPGTEWRRCQPLLFLGSPSGGAGTTSFLGTLFRRMEGKALPIYIRPFRNPLGPWKSLLRAFGEELRLPDRPRALHGWPEEPSRIQVFANDVLGALASRLVDQGKIRDSRLRSAVRFLRRHPSKVLLEGLVPEWVQWLRQDFARIVPAAEELLSELGPWEDHLQNWLWAIHGLAVRAEDRIIRDACRRWIFGEPLDWSQAIRANLSVAPGDLEKAAITDDERLCRGHIEDLLRLSSLSKPFLLAFDNADAWGIEPALASAAGLLLEKVQEASPAFLLLAAHLGRWSRSVLPCWSEKQRSLLSPLPPLREVEKSEAAELLDDRIARFEERRRTVRSDWIDDAYRSRSSLPVRSLLLSCALRWDVEHPIEGEPSSIRARWLRDARVQWEIVAPNLPYRWIAEWALLPLEPPDDFGWRREEAGSLGLFCARRMLPETDLLLFADAQALRTDLPAFLSFLQRVAEDAKGQGRVLELQGLIFEGQEWAAPANRSLPESGLPGLSLLRLSPEETLDLTAAVSLSFSFRRERESSSVGEASSDRAAGILSSWPIRPPESPSPPPCGPRNRELSLPLIEAVRDAVRARKVLPLSALLQRLPRHIGREQVFSAAGILSEIQVRTGSALEPLFCWQP